MNQAHEQEGVLPLPLFSEIKDLHPLSKQALQTMGLTRMTEIQAKTWNAAVAGSDVLGRARTGTGKTIAFLLPSIERLMLSHSKSRDSITANGNNNNKGTAGIEMLVLSPTRELAAQIADQAGQLLMMAGTSRQDGGNKNSGKLSVQIMFGGTNKNQDLTRLERKVPTILVSTPGRLKDHLENNSVVKGVPVSTLFGKTKLLVLDETDRLLDMGFRRDVETIISFLPPKKQRQTLLFSATLPQEVRQVLQDTMKADYVTVDCIHNDNADPTSTSGTTTTQHTNAQVAQSHVFLRADTNLVTGTVDILLKLLQNNNNNHNEKADQDDNAVKMVVFFSTAKMVAYYASLFNDGLGVPVWEIHSRKSQSYRTAASKQFREADRGVLFTSDVSARGVDYPDVTHVVQFGIADSRESYIHRLGRTGRAGKQGEGLLVLSDLEKGFLKELHGIEVPLNKDMQGLVDSPSSSSLERLQPIFSSIRNGKNTDLVIAAESAYRAMLGFYNGKLKRVSGGSGTSSSTTETLVDFANGWAMQSGLSEIPAIELKTIRKMGLENARGLRIEKNNPTFAKTQHNANVAGRGGGGGGNSSRGRSVPPSRHSSKANNRDGLGKVPVITNHHAASTHTGKSNARQQQPRHNNGSRGPPANSASSGGHKAAAAAVAFVDVETNNNNNSRPPPQNHRRTDDSRKRSKEDSESTQKRRK